jgi:peptide/nickel transport system substrate-binding protein
MRPSTDLAVALLLAGALGGCGGGAPVPASSTSAPAEFIDVVAALPRSLDPGEEQGSAWERVETSLAATLVRPAGSPLGARTLAPAGRVTGFLASSWRALADGDYVFELRRDVRSPFGDELSATDVRFSFERELALSATARFLARAGRIDAANPVTVLGRYRVRINVSGPSTLTLPLLGNFRFGVLDARAVAAHATRSDPSATGWLSDHLAYFGAWKLLGFAPASKLLVAANRHFWRPLGFRLVAIEAVSSASVRLADVAAAAADHTSELDWADFAIATRTSGLRAVASASSAISALIPNERFRPFASGVVRRVLGLALDRRAISRAAYAGFAEPAGPTVRNVSIARLGLAEAGYPRGFRLVLGVDPDTPPAEVKAVVTELAAAGVTVTVRRADGPAPLARLARDATVGAVLETLSVPVASPTLAILTDDLPDSPDNLGGYDSAKLNALEGALEAGRPASATASAADILSTAFASIPLVEVPEQQVSLAAVQGYAAYPDGALYYDELRG